MIIGVPSEVKNREYRVGMIPGTVRALVDRGHTVLVQRGAGEGSGLPDDLYREAGAKLVDGPDPVWGEAEMIVKVKEPIAIEYDRIRPEQIIYTYFHLAAVPELAEVLLAKRVAAVAYETIELPDRTLPLLHPMSEVAGKMAPQVGAQCLQKEHGGKGLLLGGVPGVKRGEVLIIGGGVVGINAAKVAVGMGANVTVLDIDVKRLNYLDDVFLGRVQTLYSDQDTLARLLPGADLVIGAVLVTGARAPKLVTREHLKLMEDGSVVVDVAVDQGGCIETCRPTTHDNPTYVEEGVVHYCVANMPGAVAQTSTFALNNTTRRYAIAIADRGLRAACAADPALALGLNTLDGTCTHPAVAASLGYEYKAPRL
ncbi:MAG: alanine dehydrogenase [bacterium]|nr:alanine dehydrogenase [Myxococcales bacterium]MCB9550581.1 alanine dehydrogenase [Myxococcales bacterium]